LHWHMDLLYLLPSCCFWPSDNSRCCHPERQKKAAGRHMLMWGRCWIQKGCYLIKSQKLLTLVVTFFLWEHSHPFGVLGFEQHPSGLFSTLWSWVLSFQLIGNRQRRKKWKSCWEAGNSRTTICTTSNHRPETMVLNFICSPQASTAWFLSPRTALLLRNTEQ
jgi:hypothetical protein